MHHVMLAIANSAASPGCPPANFPPNVPMQVFKNTGVTTAWEGCTGTNHSPQGENI